MYVFICIKREQSQLFVSMNQRPCYSRQNKISSLNSAYNGNPLESRMAHKEEYIIEDIFIIILKDIEK